MITTQIEGYEIQHNRDFTGEILITDREGDRVSVTFDILTQIVAMANRTANRYHVLLSFPHTPERARLVNGLGLRWDSGETIEDRYHMVKEDATHPEVEQIEALCRANPEFKSAIGLVSDWEQNV